MSKLSRILVSRFTITASMVSLLALGACGQKGALYLPDSPAAQNRASLPETLVPVITPASAPTTTTKP
jgi:predicted small lipoprotein YifL